MTHTEPKRGSTLVERLTYERSAGGEPSMIWLHDSTSGNWNAGEAVSLTYVNGLRVRNDEDLGAC